MKELTLFKNPWVSIKQKGSWIYSHFTKSNSHTVGVLPYRLYNLGLQFGTVYEDIPCHSGPTLDNKYLITGAVEESEYHTIVNELKEEAGVTADLLEFIPLGNYYPLKHSDCKLSLYCIDITGKEVGRPTTDGSEHEAAMRFSFYSYSEIMQNSKDPNLIAACALVIRMLKGDEI